MKKILIMFSLVFLSHNVWACTDGQVKSYARQGIWTTDQFITYETCINGRFQVTMNERREAVAARGRLLSDDTVRERSRRNQQQEAGMHHRLFGGVR